MWVGPLLLGECLSGGSSWDARQGRRVSSAVLGVRSDVLRGSEEAGTPRLPSPVAASTGRGLMSGKLQNSLLRARNAAPESLAPKLLAPPALSHLQHFEYQVVTGGCMRMLKRKESPRNENTKRTAVGLNWR